MPLLEVGVIKNPAIRVFQQSAFGVLDTLLVVARIGAAYVLDASFLLLDLVHETSERAYSPFAIQRR
jgi:hypothetical protein